MFTHQLDQHLALKLISEEDAEPLLNCVTDDRQKMAKWLPWANNMHTVADELAFIKQSRHEFAEGKMLPLTIILDGLPIGAIDLHNIEDRNHHAEIGYWLSNRYQGKGIMTRSAQRVLTIGFDELNLHKISLDADVDNVASQGVATRLNMTLEGTSRDELLINNEYRSMKIYSMLESEWDASES